VPDLLEFAALAAARGSAYALIAAGFALVFGVGRLLNLFHGTFFLLGAYVVYWLSAGVGTQPGAGAMLAVTLAAASIVAALGAAEFHLLLQPQGDKPIQLMAVGLAANLLVETALRAGAGTRGVLVPPIVPGSVAVGSGRVPSQEFVVGVTALVVFATAWLLLRRSRAGVALRAVAQDRRGALVVGIDPLRALRTTVAVSAFLAALAGALTAPLRVVHPGLWSFALLKSLTVVIVGGIGSLGGAVVAAYAIGALEVLATYTVGEAKADVIVMALAIAALLVRPRGLFDAEPA
jgi:branched-chain amino acid transport system permease protein